MRTLIIRQGGIGDLIMLSNALIKYKEKTRADIDLATLPENVDLMKGVWFLSDVLPMDQISDKNGYDETINLLMAVEPPQLYRTDYGRGRLEVKKYTSQNRVDVFEELLGVHNGAEKRFEIAKPPQKAYDRIQSILKPHKGKKVIAIHGACNSSLRAIPIPYISELCHLIKKNFNCVIILFGQLRRWASNILDLKADGIINLIDQLNLSETIALIDSADVIIGPDSGGIHLAGALKRPAIAIFGNINPTLRTAYYSTVKPLYPADELDCIPCNDIPGQCRWGSSIGGGAPCMRLLNPGRIMNELSEILTEMVDVKPNGQGKRAIVYFSNGLGNFVMMMPAIEALASMTESKKVDICFNAEWRDIRRPLVEDICRAWPIINRIINWPEEEIKDDDYDLWFYSAHSANSDVVLKFIRNMKPRPVPKPEWRKSFIHESDHYFEIVNALGYLGSIPKVTFPIAEEPNLNDLPRPIIGLCNGWFKTDGMYWKKKEWPHFKELAKTLKLYFGGSVIGVGGQDEFPTDIEIELDINFTGKLSILQTAKVLSQLDLFITTDTGLMHIADILDVRLIALFGPTLSSKNSPRGKNSSVLSSGLECAPCQYTSRFDNCQKFACMEGILIGDVMAKAREKLRNIRGFCE